MKVNIQHILLGGVFSAIMAVASSAQANVETKVVNIAVPSVPSAMTTVGASAWLEAPNQSVIKLARKKVSASKAKKIARSHVGGGEFVDISVRGNTYKVRVIAKNGKVIDVLIDANTGRVK